MLDRHITLYTMLPSEIVILNVKNVYGDIHFIYSHKF